MLRIIGSKLLTVIALLSSVIAASADFSGSDNFNDNSKDLTKWGTDILTGTFGGAALNETNTRLEYTSTSATDIDVLRPWIANNGSFTSNWRLQIDVNVPTRTLSVGQAYGFEFGVRNSANVNDTFYVSLELNNFGTQTRSFFSTFDVNGVAQPPDAGSVTTSTSAALQIRYDAGTGTLFADFDADVRQAVTASQISTAARSQDGLLAGAEPLTPWSAGSRRADWRLHQRTVFQGIISWPSRSLLRQGFCFAEC